MSSSNTRTYSKVFYTLSHTNTDTHSLCSHSTSHPPRQLVTHLPQSLFPSTIAHNLRYFPRPPGTALSTCEGKADQTVLLTGKSFPSHLTHLPKFYFSSQGKIVNLRFKKKKEVSDRDKY